jgi:hypothetical protein
MYSSTLSLTSALDRGGWSKTFLFAIIYIYIYVTVVSRDGSVGITTRYGLDGPGIESRCGAKFSAPVQTGPGVHPASYTMGTASFQG